MGNSVIHVPATIGSSMGTNTALVVIIESPSIFAAGSASSNIEAQDKDRTVNVGHHIGRLTLDVSIPAATSSGILECTVFKVERHDTTPVLGTHPVPSAAECLAQGSQQACRMANPGKVFHYSGTPYSAETTRVKKIAVSPAKYRLSKVKAGDHWVLLLFNRGLNGVSVDIQMRYNEYE